MPLAALVDLSDVILERGEFALIPGTFNTRATAALNGKAFLLPIERVGFTPFNSALQKRTGPVDVVQPAKVVETYVVVNKTAQELDDEKTAIANVDVDLRIQKAVAAEVRKRDEEIISTLNALIAELSATTPELTSLTVPQWRTRLIDKYKSLLP